MWRTRSRRGGDVRGADEADLVGGEHEGGQGGTVDDGGVEDDEVVAGAEVVHDALGDAGRDVVHGRGAIGRGDDVEAALVVGDEAFEQVGVEAVDILDELGEEVDGVLDAEVQGDVAEFVLVVDEEDLLAVAANEMHGEMNGEGGGADTRFCAEKGDDLAQVLGAERGGGMHGLEAGKGARELDDIDGLTEEVVAAGAHGAEQEAFV